MTIRLPKELYERLRLEAFRKRVSQASIIVEAVEGHLGTPASEKEGRSDTQSQ